MQSTNLPSKYLVPFATNDSAKVEIPVTTATVGRASQSLGFPPITGQPPETGGLPPQLEDFNGAVNQIARVAWWAQLGGQWKYDAAFATDSNINGYPAGAELQSVADNRVTWLSLVDNNTADPDATGTGWVPLTSYAPATITTAGGTTTPTLPIAAHETLIVSGTLSSNAVLILPVWARGWTITNSTTGAFTVTVKTAAGSGVVIPQNGAPTRVTGDGTNIVQPSQNIPTATTASQAISLGQATGRLINTQVFSAAGTATYTPTAGTTKVRVTVQGGGGGGGGALSNATQGAISGGGGAGACAVASYVVASVTGQTVTVGAGGVGGIANTSNPTAGGASSIGALVVAPGGGASGNAAPASPPGTNGGTGLSTAPTGATLFGVRGGPGTYGLLLAANSGVAGPGGASYFGAGPSGPSANTSNGNPGINAGTGGSGCTSAVTNTGGATGGAGAAGIVIIEEYA